MANILHIFPVKPRRAVPFSSQIQACYPNISTLEIIKLVGRFLDSSQMCAETQEKLSFERNLLEIFRSDSLTFIDAINICI